LLTLTFVPKVARNVFLVETLGREAEALVVCRRDENDVQDWVGRVPDRVTVHEVSSHDPATWAIGRLLERLANKRDRHSDDGERVEGRNAGR
jgi:hypothetical protein